MELKELNPELFLWELYNMAGCYQLDTALHIAESLGYCDASRLAVRPRTGEYALMIEYKNGEKCWFHVPPKLLELIKQRFERKKKGK